MSKGEPVPEGIYHVRIAKITMKTPEPKEKNPDPWPYFNLDFVIAADPRTPEELQGRHVFDINTLEPGKNFAARQLAVAVFGDADDELDVIEKFTEGAFQDAELQIAVKVQKEGKGADGKWYDARNQVAKRMAIQS
jgi:hypothetical protein